MASPILDSSGRSLGLLHQRAEYPKQSTLCSGHAVPHSHPSVSGRLQIDPDISSSRWMLLRCHCSLASSTRVSSAPSSRLLAKSWLARGLVCPCTGEPLSSCAIQPDWPGWRSCQLYPVATCTLHLSYLEHWWVCLCRCSHRPQTFLSCLRAPSDAQLLSACTCRDAIYLPQPFSSLLAASR